MTPATQINWATLWDERAAQTEDFSATGRGGMNVVGFLHTIREVARALSLKSDDTLLDIGCGTGIVALALSCSVAKVHGIDLSGAMIERARTNCADCDNISFAVGSILDPVLADRQFSKVLAYSVLQYLSDEAQVLSALQSCAKVLPIGGQAFFAANPDPVRRHLYVEQVQASNRTEADKQRSLYFIDQTLWVDPDRMIDIAAQAGFAAQVLPISPRIWQHFYMFDLLVTKRG